MPATSVQAKKGNKGLLAVLVILLILFAGLITGLLIVTREQPQDIRNRAQEVRQEPLCPVDGATCEWSLQADDPSIKNPANKYHVIIKDVTDPNNVKDVKDFVAVNGQRIARFTAQLNHKYRCRVIPVNECGVGPANEKVVTCSANVTETPTVTPSGPITITLTNTPTPTEEIVTETPTPTETVTVSNTPTPTGTVILSNTPTPTGEVEQPTATPTEIVIAEASPTEEAVPTIAEAGSSAGVYFMVISGIILITLMLVF